MQSENVKIGDIDQYCHILLSNEPFNIIATSELQIHAHKNQPEDIECIATEKTDNCNHKNDVSKS